MSRPESITCREFVRRAAAAAVAIAPEPADALAQAAVVPAIDTHTHFYDPARPRGVPWPPRSDTLLYRTYLPEHFAPLARAHGVVGTIVIEASPWLEDNQWVLDLARESPLIAGFIGNLPVGQPEFAGHLRRFGENPLFRGVRLHRTALSRGQGQRAFDSDLRRMAEQELTLDVLGGVALLPEVARIATLAPGLRIVIDHLPFAEFDGNPEVARSALSELRELPNVYAKVSNVVRRQDGRVILDPAFYRRGLDVLWERFGPDRVLFGSNWPVSERVAPYSLVHRVVADYVGARGSSVAERFFWKNSLAAYRWPVCGVAACLGR